MRLSFFFKSRVYFRHILSISLSSEREEKSNSENQQTTPPPPHQSEKKRKEQNPIKNTCLARQLLQRPQFLPSQVSLSAFSLNPLLQEHT